MSLDDELAAHAALRFEHARMLPCDAYTSASLLDEELTRIFGHEWVCLGRTASIPKPGDYFTGEVPSVNGGRNVVVIRGDDLHVRAFDNVCVHRGANLLTEPCGHEARITCPYHAWVYRTDGQLIGAPYMHGTVDATGNPFDPARYRLGELSVEIWEGFVFVAVGPDPVPLAPRLHGLTEMVEPFAMADYVPVHQQIDVWQTNWKLLVENFMDAYHIFKVHRGTFAKDGDNTVNTSMFPGSDGWAHHVVCKVDGADIAHPHNSTLEGSWRKSVVLVSVFPTHVIQLQPDWLWYLQISPLGIDRVRIRWEVAVAPEMLAAQADPAQYVSSVLELLNAVNAEDQPVVEGVFRSMHRPQFPRAPFSYLERNVYDFDRYVARMLTGNDEPAG